MVFIQAALNRQTRNFRRVLATEFFFLNGEEHGMLINESHCRASPQSGYAKNEHGRGQAAPSATAKSGSRGKAIRSLPSWRATDTVNH